MHDKTYPDLKCCIQYALEKEHYCYSKYVSSSITTVQNILVLCDPIIKILDQIQNKDTLQAFVNPAL